MPLEWKNFINWMRYLVREKTKQKTHYKFINSKIIFIRYKTFK